MDTLRLFTERIPKLENLSDKPEVFWYVSAGDDFRGPVFLSDYHINHVKKHNGRELVKPELFIFNSIGPEVRNLKKNLAGGRFELFNDGITRIVGVNFKVLNLRTDLDFQINPNYIDVPRSHALRTAQETFYFEIEIKSEGWRDKHKILYFEHENIDFFHKVILKSIFNVVYFCAVQEGTGMGHCLKSTVDHIYKDSAPLFYSNYGFAPTYNILYTDFTNTLFKEATDSSEHLDVRRDYAKYIQSKAGHDNSIIYKISYKDLHQLLPE